MSIEAPSPTSSSGGTRGASAPLPTATTTTSAVLQQAPRAGPDREVSYVSTIPAAPPASIERIEQPVVVEPAARPTVPNPTSVDQVSAAGSDPSRVAVAATAVTMSMLAPAPFGPSIIIPDTDDGTITTVTTTAPAAPSATSSEPSLYALFQTAIVANGATPTPSGIRRTIADIIPKPQPASSAPVA